MSKNQSEIERKMEAIRRKCKTDHGTNLYLLSHEYTLFLEEMGSKFLKEHPGMDIEDFVESVTPSKNFLRLSLGLQADGLEDSRKARNASKVRNPIPNQPCSSKAVRDPVKCVLSLTQVPSKHRGRNDPIKKIMLQNNLTMPARFRQSRKNLPQNCAVYTAMNGPEQPEECAQISEDSGLVPSNTQPSFGNSRRSQSSQPGGLRMNSAGLRDFLERDLSFNGPSRIAHDDDSVDLPREYSNTIINSTPVPCSARLVQDIAAGLDELKTMVDDALSSSSMHLEDCQEHEESSILPHKRSPHRFRHVILDRGHGHCAGYDDSDRYCD